MTAGGRSTSVVRPAVPILVLAAGASTRLGRPKQLVQWRSETLLHRAARVALEAATGPVLVLLGAGAAACRAAIADLAALTLEVEDWQAGMGRTIAAGVGAVRQRWPEAEAVVIMAADQPLLAAAHLRALGATGRPVAAAAYAGTLGIPAYFGRERFPDLLALAPSSGAAALLKGHPEDVATVDFPGGAFDVDEEKDLDRLQQFS